MQIFDEQTRTHKVYRSEFRKNRVNFSEVIHIATARCQQNF